MSGLGGDALLAQPLSFDYEDSDLDAPDLICKGAYQLSAADVHAGGFTYRCNNGSSARFSLHNSDRGTPAL